MPAPLHTGVYYAHCCVLPVYLYATAYLELHTGVPGTCTFVTDFTCHYGGTVHAVPVYYLILIPACLPADLCPTL